jgi:hypothetical protein
MPDIRKYPEFHRSLDELQKNKQAILNEIHSGISLGDHGKIRTYVSPKHEKTAFLANASREYKNKLGGP